MAKCCDCDCTCSLDADRHSGSWLRSVKRKYDDFEKGNEFFIPGFDFSSVARIEIENECDALREMVSSQQRMVQDLYAELEEERNASASAANEAMSMILRLQSEKAGLQMDLRQFKRFAEEKMSHDQEEMLALEDLLYKREQAIQSLTCEAHAYRYRMMSYGLTEAEADGDGERRGPSRSQSMNKISASQYEFPAYDYPPLKCKLNETLVASEVDNEVVDVEKYAFGETPRDRGHLKNLEYRICQLEGTPKSIDLDGDFGSTKNILPEKVVVNRSPRQMKQHPRRFSIDSSNSFMGSAREMGPDLTAETPGSCTSFKKMDHPTHTDEYSSLKKKLDNACQTGDDTSDRVYTIDFVHNGVSHNGVSESKAEVWNGEDYVTTPRGSLNRIDVEDPDVQKLYMRLQALEADRESMKQTIISMRTDKAQLILLREIAQQLCKGAQSDKKIIVNKKSIIRSSSVAETAKWIMSLSFWRRRARRSKYNFGLSTNNMGLLMLLDKGPRMRQLRCLSSTQV